MKSFIVKSPLTHDGDDYAIGDEIELSDEQAAGLLDVGAIVSADDDQALDELSANDDVEEIKAVLAIANEALEAEKGAHQLTKDELAQVKSELETAKAALANVPAIRATNAGEANGESTASADAIAEQTNKDTNPELASAPSNAKGGKPK